MPKTRPISQEASAETPELPSDMHPDMETSAREAADLEEKLMAERVAQARQSEQETERLAEPEPEQTLIGLAAKGREYLLEEMRKHQEKPKPVYVPPALTDKMRANIEAEMEAGRRTQAKHEAQQASRPPRLPEPGEGTSVPVHRPGDYRPSVNSRIL